VTRAGIWLRALSFIAYSSLVIMVGIP
jgi:hypothetical protein